MSKLVKQIREDLAGKFGQLGTRDRRRRLCCEAPCSLG
jgi:hypothetical protein